ncbi:MAG: Gfo/Idh/MocA family oxidoreductase [Fuerstiella sp.]|nr:Gfo/Idh/MocA family oxidoreductase [Fuerstiella sp.]
MTLLNRRDFIRASASISAGVYSSCSAVARHSSSVLDKLNIACIGTANRAVADIQGVMSQNIVALCDIDGEFLAASQKMIQENNGATPAGFADYREMIDQMGDKFDAVVVATPDHHHAPATIRAIKAGKHVYCEKPLTHTVQEARIIAEAAEKAGVATQMGTQIHAMDNYRRVVEIIQSGAIGDVHQVHVWVGKTWGGGERPKQADPVPKHVNWELWLGPAPTRLFKKGLYHPGQWRRWWDFGSGTLGDMACHYMDLPFWALNLTHPTYCRAEGPEQHPDSCPLGLTVYYKFPATNKNPALELTWYDGNMIPKEIHGRRVKANGVMFVGADGMMFADYKSYRLFPQDKYVDFVPPAKSIPDSIGHHNEWIQACMNGTPTTCNFTYSGALTEAVQLGNVAYRTGVALEWDAKNLRANNTDLTAEFVSKDHTSGWEVS